MANWRKFSLPWLCVYNANMEMVYVFQNLVCVVQLIFFLQNNQLGWVAKFHILSFPSDFRLVLKVTLFFFGHNCFIRKKYLTNMTTIWKNFPSIFINICF